MSWKLTVDENKRQALEGFEAFESAICKILGISEGNVWYFDDLPESVKDEYGFVRFLCMTEMLGVLRNLQNGDNQDDLDEEAYYMLNKAHSNLPFRADIFFKSFPHLDTATFTNGIEALDRFMDDVREMFKERKIKLFY